jgi:hypothetical protein
MYLANESLQLFSEVVVKFEMLITSLTVKLSEMGLNPSMIVMQGPTFVLMGLVLTQMAKLLHHNVRGANKVGDRAQINYKPIWFSMGVNKMFRFNRVSVAFIAVLMLSVSASVMSAGVALAAGMTVDPQIGTYTTTFKVVSEGFNANERVATWVTLSNGKTVALGELKADSSGSVEFSVTPQTSWSQGEVIVVAHGQSSQREYFAKFNINVPSDESTPTTSSGTLVATSEGLTLTYQGSGYKAGERVAAWFQHPSELGTSTAHALPDVYADANGNVSFAFTVQSNWQYGGYHISAEGYESKHVTYNTFSFFGTITDQRTYYANAGTVSSGVWLGQYFNNTDLSGSPVLVRQVVDPQGDSDTLGDADLNFDWGTGSPSAAVQSDNFSAKWDTTRNFSTSGNYVITATADDGIRVWVDGQLMIDQWSDHAATTYTATVYLTAGNHSIHVEYYEHLIDASVSVQIEKA